MKLLKIGFQFGIGIAVGFILGGKLFNFALVMLQMP